MIRNPLLRIASVLFANLFFLGIISKPVVASPNHYSRVSVESHKIQMAVLDDKIRPPAAHDDSYSMDANTTLSVSAALGVLANDTSSSQLPLTALLVSKPSHGSLDLNPNGSFTYTPVTDYHGTDEFKYKAYFKVNDVIYYSNNATVRISVRVPNDPPVATSDTYTVTANTTLTIDAPGVLANDHDPQGTALTAIPKSHTSHGAMTLNKNGSFTYTPIRGFLGQDSFTYTASDGSLQSNIATVELIVIDNIKPVVNWIAPVNNQGIYNFDQGIVTLEVNATDNVKIDRIRFIWWNSASEEFVELGEVSSQPFQISLDTTMLNSDWNQIFAVAYDTSGNASDRQFIWLLNEPPTLSTYLPLIGH